MENFGKKDERPKLYDTEIQGYISTNEGLVKEAQQLIDDGLELIKEGVEILEEETAYLQHLENREMFEGLEEDNMKLGESKERPANDIEKSKQKIKFIQDAIEKLKTQISTLTLWKAETDAYGDELKGLQDQLNQIILRIDRAQLN